MKAILTLIILSISIASIQTAEAKSKGIENMQLATKDIYRGARPINNNELKILADKGIKSILNLQGGDLLSIYWPIVKYYEPGERAEVIEQEKNRTLALNMSFLNIPLNSLDTITEEEDKWIDEALEFMHNPVNRPIYVHCEHGHDRTGMLVALYKVKYEDLDVKTAYKEWVALGHDSKSQILTGKLDDYFYDKVEKIEIDKIIENDLF